MSPHTLKISASTRLSQNAAGGTRSTYRAPDVAYSRSGVSLMPAPRARAAAAQQRRHTAPRQQQRAHTTQRRRRRRRARAPILQPWSPRAVYTASHSVAEQSAHDVAGPAPDTHPRHSHQHGRTHPHARKHTQHRCQRRAPPPAGNSRSHALHAACAAHAAACPCPHTRHSMPSSSPLPSSDPPAPRHGHMATVCGMRASGAVNHLSRHRHHHRLSLQQRQQ